MSSVVGAVVPTCIGVVERDGAGPVAAIAVAGEAEGTGQVSLQANEGAAHEDVVGLACGLAELPVAVWVQRIRVALDVERLMIEVELGVAIEPDRLNIEYCIACP